jgi:hypothetical protein
VIDEAERRDAREGLPQAALRHEVLGAPRQQPERGRVVQRRIGHGTRGGDGAGHGHTDRRHAGPPLLHAANVNTESRHPPRRAAESWA